MPSPGVVIMGNLVAVVCAAARGTGAAPNLTCPRWDGQA
jgi:hypothetical protein